MAELTWFEQYEGQSTDELIALEGKFRVDSLVLAFQEALDQKEVRVGSENLTGEERVIQAIEAFESEVNNGGYDQFFRNSSNEYVPVIVDALTRIGCAETATLTQAAIDALGIDGPVTIESVDRVMEDENETRDSKLEECDNRYYDVAGDLAGPLLAFIKANRDRIVLTG